MVYLLIDKTKTMKIIVAICIIALGLNVLRFVFGAGMIILTGKGAGLKEPVGWKLRIANSLECVGLVVAYVLLVCRYYGWA